MGYRQHHAIRVTLRDFIEKSLQPGHLLNKRFTIRRLDSQRVRTHQIVEDSHRLTVEAGMTFVEPGVDKQGQFTTREDDFGGLAGSNR